MWGKAMAFQELFNLIENSDTLAINLAEQIKNPAKDYSYGQSTTTKS